MITTYERGKIEGLREGAMLFLDTRFGPLTPAIKNRVASLSAEQLHQLILNLADETSLQELHLQD